VYSYLNFLKNATFTIGGSGDFYDSAKPGSEPQKQFNPKFGVTWNPFPDTTIRGAAFRTFKRTLITDQTLEPTQVAGLNQFYDDFNATKAWVYGGGIDQKLFKSLFAGIAYTQRDLSIPFVTTTATGLEEQRVASRERLLRNYLFWTPYNWLALSGGYEWERFTRNVRFAQGATRAETHRLPVGFNIFHPSGVSASLTATYVNQHGSFESATTTEFGPGRDSFWNIDTAVNYRLPKRYGLLTFGVNNLTDKKFKYFDSENGAANVYSSFIPSRLIFGRLTLSFP